MCEPRDWLPGLFTLQDCSGQWNQYEEELFRQFREDWVDSRPSLRGRPVGHSSSPVAKGRPEAFWHLIQRTDKEADERIPDLRRCERLRWARALINAVGSRTDVVTWREHRQKGMQELIALDDFSYVVILAVRGKNKVFLMTAYPVDREKRGRLRKQYERARQEEGR